MLIVVGSAVTIFIFLKQKLRKRAHFLLVSLAVADLLVGFLTVPLYIAANISSVVTALEFNNVDIFTGLTSIFTLAVISLERMHSVGWPLRHRTLSLRAYKFAIVTPWILAAIITSVQSNVLGRDASTVVVISSPAAPLLVMCFAYCVIWWKGKSLMGDHNQRMEREKKFTNTLLLIIGTSLLTWLPFQILNLVYCFLPSGIKPFAIVYYIKLLQFSNSLVNVIIYPFRISEFRVALMRMLQCCVTKPSSGSEGENRSEGVSVSTV